MICSQRYPTRSERNDHVETHFVHKNCTDCNRLVILIGDVEFELHRPAHCISTAKNGDTESKDLETFIALDKVSINSTTEKIDKILAETVETEDNFEIEAISIPNDLPNRHKNDTIESIKPNTAKKRPRRKPIKTSDGGGGGTKSKTTVTKSKSNSSNQKSRPIKLLTCTQDGCEETFRQQLLLRKHLKTMHGIAEKHVCQICNFSFADKSNLKHHMVTHTDNKRFICSFCGARFHKLTNMTEHMNAHLGVKPYSCEICSKQFGRANHKRQHMRVIFYLIHTNRHQCIHNECVKLYRRFFLQFFFTKKILRFTPEKNHIGTTSIYKHLRVTVCNVMSIKNMGGNDIAQANKKSYKE